MSQNKINEFLISCTCVCVCVCLFSPKLRPRRNFRADTALAIGSAKLAGWLPRVACHGLKMG